MKIDKELRDKLVGLERSLCSDDGLELVDPQPKFVPIGPRRLSLAEQIKRVLRKEVERFRMHSEMESPEDAEDFDVPDEAPMPLSGYEVQEMIEEVIPAPEILEEEKVLPDPGEPEVPQAPGEPLPGPES